MTIGDENRAIAECLSLLKAAYPQYKFLSDHAMMELWHRKLSVLDPKRRRLAIEFWIDTEKFPPAISDILNLCNPKKIPRKTGLKLGASLHKRYSNTDQVEQARQ